MQTSTHVDGVRIIAREPAEGPHPNPGKNGVTVPFRRVSRLLLDDERELFECDECGYRRSEIHSVVSHLPKHNPAKTAPLYPEETIRTVIRLVKSYEGQRNRCQLAAEELNRRGVRPHRVEAWSGQTVSRLFNRYKSVFHVRVSRQIVSGADGDRTSSPTLASPARPGRRSHSDVRRRANTSDAARSPKLDHLVVNLSRRVGALALQLAALEQELIGLAGDVTTALSRSTVDAETREKARRWDEMRRLMS